MKLKNNNGKYLIITTLALLLSVTFFFIINKKIENSKKKDYVKKFTIEYLREKDFPEQSINIERSLGKKSNFESYIISYFSDGLKLYALMNIPNSKMPENGYPVVIVNHGYIPPKKYSTIDSYKLVSSYFANNGFLTLKPDYRGHDNSKKGEGGRPFNRFNYTEDVINLLYAVKNINKADTDNLFMYGHSMGGDITLRILEITDKVKAATLWSPVSIMFPESLLFFIRRGGTETAKSIESVIKSIFKDEDYPKVSAIANINYIKAPIILHHGTDDESVPYEWSLQLTDKFDEAKIDYKFYTYKGEDHNFAKKSFYSVLKKDVEFFKSKIK
ncbi:MAG: alpha/beta fold hydrolase [Spirochaetes bacterium]|nr:alpha/beta fold hydrolase [Spirochaetota bacterium]